VAEGRKRFKGELAGVEDDQVGIDLEGEDAHRLIPFAWIIDAKLVSDRSPDEAGRRPARGAPHRHATIGDEDADDIDLSESEED
jgi:ribosome maturation factor RimP